MKLSFSACGADDEVHSPASMSLPLSTMGLCSALLLPLLLLLPKARVTWFLHAGPGLQGSLAHSQQ